MDTQRDYTRTCFVVMPYGKRPVHDRKQKVDFDRIYEVIFKPAVQCVEADGKSMEPLRASDRMDSRELFQAMIQDLLSARLVLADFSIDNTNVGYEIGRRDALSGGTVYVHLRETIAPFVLRNRYAVEYVNRPQTGIGRSIGEISKSLQASLPPVHDASYVAGASLADRMGDPMNPTPLGKKVVEAELAARAGQVDEALTAYAEAVELHPQEAMLREIYGASLLAAGRDADAKHEFETALQLNRDLSAEGRILSDIEHGPIHDFIARYRRSSPVVPRLDIRGLTAALGSLDEAYIKVVPEKRPEGLLYQFAVIGGPEVDIQKILGAAAGSGPLYEYPSQYYPDCNRTLWSFDVHAPHATSTRSALNSLKQSLSVLPGPKKIDFGGGGGSFSGGGLGGIF
jgi:tetratricopeptide (TPR) repeat protein